MAVDNGNGRNRADGLFGEGGEMLCRPHGYIYLLIYFHNIF